MNKNKDCAYWSTEKKEIAKCRTECDCPRMQYNFSTIEHRLNLTTLIRENYISLDDISDEDWMFVNAYFVIEEQIKREEEETKQRRLGILGKSKGAK
jgi:hypothetical protein